MIKTALKGVMANKSRLVSTILSIVIGVAFVSGTFVFSDTINNQFEGLFSDVYAGVDSTVRTAGDPSKPFDESVIGIVEQAAGVEAAAGYVNGYAQLIGTDGAPVGGLGPPTLGFSWIEEHSLNALSIKNGNGVAPSNEHEVVIDAATAENTGFALGDSIDIATQSGVGTYTLVGIANFGDEDTLLGATLTAFTLDEAQRLFGVEGQFTGIDVIAAAGIDSDALTEQLAEIVPAGLEAVTGAEQSQEQLDSVAEGLGFMTAALLAFAGIAVFVGSFIIYNTFRIIVGQRTRELALLRAIGAESRQVTRMVILESLIVGLIASVIGVFTGVGLAGLLRTGMNAVGFSSPPGDLILGPRTVIVGLIVGVTVTLASAIVPAVKAANILPVAAMRSEAVETTAPKSLRRRSIIGGLMTTLGVLAIAIALIGEVSSALYLVAGGALTVFLGITVLAPLFARPIACLLGKPLRGIVGQLATENTRRSPRRTASTASALMIGVALVVFVSVFAASIKSSVAETFDSAFPADLIMTSSNPSNAAPLGALEDIRQSPDVAVASAVMFADMDLGEEELDAAAVEPSTIGSVLDLKSSIDIAELGSDMLVHEEELGARNWAVGDVVDLSINSQTARLQIVGTFEEVSVATYIVSQQTLSEHQELTTFDMGLVKLIDGVNAEDGLSSAKAATSEFPAVNIASSAETIAAAEAQVDQLVSLFYGLLGLAILIAMIGITNTLTLSVAERTREIGLLRAVGLNRRKTSAMIRWEATMIGVFGALLGVGVGSALGWAVVTSLADDGLSTLNVPWPQLGAWVVLGGLAGVIASIRPARKAAKMDVLDAIAYQ